MNNQDFGKHTRDFDYYVEFIKRELDGLTSSAYVGDVSFKFNLNQGGVVNMNIGTNKSIKAPKVQ